MTATHTPTPYRITGTFGRFDSPEGEWLEIRAVSDVPGQRHYLTVGRVGVGTPTVEGRAHARATAGFICRACNAHDALVEALTLAVARLERIDKKLVELNGQPFENELGEVIRARKALALAKGEA